MKPLISIVVPVYQVEQYIENCIKSICDQTFKDFEVIMVNDGTKDKSMEIAEKILKGSETKYSIIDQENKGLAAARNIGMKNSNGKWVIYVDSDDIINKDFLKILYGAGEKYEVEVSIGNFQYVTCKELFKSPDKVYESVLVKKEEMLKGFLTRKIRVIVPAILMNKDFITKNNLFFDESIKFSEDQQFIWRVLLSSDKHVYNKTPIYNYLLRPNSIMTSSSIEKIMTGYQGFLKFTDDLKNKEEVEFCEMIMARWVFGVLHSSAKMLSLGDFKKLAYEIKYELYFEELLKFCDIRINILTRILKKNLFLFYYISKKL